LLSIGPVRILSSLTRERKGNWFLGESEKRTGRDARNFSAILFGFIFLGLILIIPLLVLVSGIILISEGKHVWGVILLVLGVLAGIGPFFRFLRSSMSKKDAVKTSEKDEQGSHK
jgi:hypothetical protein